jgi:alkanesulfonate monooxygenase SsuD/methylene tetrahydromethanopterin reductase-like flavin-dependent oxidoreductase (luciferase family)
LKVDFGARVPVSGPLASAENILGAAKELESLGFDTVWVHDQLLWGREQNDHHISSGSVEAVVPGRNPDFFESITTLGYLAGVTRSIKLGVATIVIPLRHPVVLARQIMNLDVLSKGRLIFGVGSGAPFVGKTFETINVPFDKRGEITDDYLKAILSVFHEKSPSYAGKYTKFEAIDVFPKSLQKPHPPIIVGGLGRGPKRAALYGEGWIPANITCEGISKGLEKIKSIAKKNGRIISNFAVANEIFTSIDKDPSAARKNAAATIASYARSIGRGSEEVTLLGSPSEVHKKIEKYVEAGVNMFELKFIYKDIASLYSQLRLFQAEITSSFR